MQLEFEASNNKEYKIKNIQNNAVYTKELVTKQLVGLYYRILWKSYFEEKNTQEPALAI